MGRLRKGGKIVDIISTNFSDKELSQNIGKLVEKGKAKFLYYGSDQMHYEVYDGELKKLK